MDAVVAWCATHPQTVCAAATFSATLLVLGVKGIIGGLVGLVKLPCVLLPAIVAGKTPPAFTPGAPLGAELLWKDTQLDELKPQPLNFKDVELTSADGTKLHAVEDDGGRREAGKRPLVFVH